MSAVCVCCNKQRHFYPISSAWLCALALCYPYSESLETSFKSGNANDATAVGYCLQTQAVVGQNCHTWTHLRLSYQHRKNTRTSILPSWPFMGTSEGRPHLRAPLGTAKYVFCTIIIIKRDFIRKQ